MLAVLLAALDGTIVATALPTITAELGGLNQLSWVVTGYLLASTISTPLYGKLGDLYGRKRVFQGAIVIFLIGSALCGQAQGMGELIAFRTLQGLGGGGLIVLAQAIIGDIVSPRDRGRYQGVIGAVFGVSSVAGPLLGGFLVDNASWRWIFYVNIPIGIVALAVIAVALRAPEQRRHARIDVLGTILLSLAAGCFVLATSLGGATYGWGSWQIIGLGVVTVVSTAVLIPVEKRAAEPVLPMSLFSSRVFTVAGAIGFIVGFALFGATTYLPLFLQIVTGASPTGSGLQLLPLILGLLVTSIGSGQIIARWGRYKPFPIAGTAIMVVGFWRLSTMEPSTSGARALARHGHPRPRDRPRHAGAGARRPERRRLPRPRRGDLGRDVLPLDRRLLRRRHLRRDLLQPPRRRALEAPGASRPRSGRAASRARWSPSCRPRRGRRSSAPIPTR